MGNVQGKGRQPQISVELKQVAYNQLTHQRSLAPGLEFPKGA